MSPLPCVEPLRKGGLDALFAFTGQENTAPCCGHWSLVAEHAGPEREGSGQQFPRSPSAPSAPSPASLSRVPGLLWGLYLGAHRPPGLLRPPLWDPSPLPGHLPWPLWHLALIPVGVALNDSSEARMTRDTRSGFILGAHH